ncbi:MAG: hypothetical protein OHK0021_25250 [Bryobacter sp.]
MLIPAASLYAGDVTTYRTTVRIDQSTGKLVRRLAVPKTATLRATPARVPAAERAAVNKIVEQAARQHGLDPRLAQSVLAVESAYNQYATSPKGAMGYMQLMPGTAKMLGVKNAYDAQQNIEAGVRYLRYLKTKFQDERLVLAAYNAGEGAVKKYGDIPPYRETIDYVAKVGRRLAADAPSTSQPAPPEVLAAAPAQPKIQQTLDAEGRIVLSVQ